MPMRKVCRPFLYSQTECIMDSVRQGTNPNASALSPLGARRHGVRGHQLHAHATGADHAVRADIGHDDGTVTNPTVRPDPHLRELPTLILNRAGVFAEMVLSAATQDVHVAADRGVATDQ